MARLTVKQVAKLAGISVRALHHYDEIGLLRPVFTGTNGYRHYGPEELLRLQQILIHREMEIPLSRIAELTRRLLHRAEEEGRKDDTEDVIRQRLQTYQHETAPLIDHYRDRGMLLEVDGMQPIEKVTDDIVAMLDRMLPGG